MIPYLLVADASSQESRESDNEEREVSQPWPSFDTSERATTDGAAMQWPELSSPPIQSNGEDEPLSGGEEEGSGPQPLNGTADEQIVMPELELPVEANLVELPQKVDSHIPAEAGLLTGPLPSGNDLPPGPLPSQAATNVHGNQTPPPAVHGNQTPPPAAPTGKRPTSRQKKGFKMAINFSQPLGATGMQPGGMAGMQPGGVTGMQPGSVAGMQPGGVARAQPGNSTTSTVSAMPPLQDCGDSDSV